MIEEHERAWVLMARARSAEQRVFGNEGTAKLYDEGADLTEALLEARLAGDAKAEAKASEKLHERRVYWRGVRAALDASGGTPAPRKRGTRTKG